MQFNKFFNPFLKNENIKTCVLSMKARSGQNHDNKIAPQVDFCFNYTNTFFIHAMN